MSKVKVHGGLTILQHRIWTILEETGEDDVSALINTVGRCRGAINEITLISTALRDLVERNLIEVGRSRDALSFVDLSSKKK